MIQRQLSQHQFILIEEEDDYDGRIEQKVMLRDVEIKEYEVNNSAFELISWFTNEKRMDEIVQIQNDLIIEDKEQQIDQNNYKKMQKQLDQMIFLIKDIKDNELGNGMIQLINQGIYQILFGIAQRMNENEIKEFLTELQNIFYQVNYNIIYNIITKEFFLWIYFMIEECLQNKLSLTIKEKLVQLNSQILLRGAQMATNIDINHFKYLFQYSKLKFSFESLVDNKQSKRELNEEDQKIKDKIRKQSAIGYYCIVDGNVFYGDKFNVWIELFEQKLKQFNINIMKQQQTIISSISKIFIYKSIKIQKIIKIQIQIQIIIERDNTNYES